MRRLAIAIALTLIVSIAAAAAHAELVQQGNLRVFFAGKLLPRALPREHAASVTVSLDGSVATVDGSVPPQLRRISIAVNRAAQISVAGLPRCPSGELEQTSTKAALKNCRSALVGRGRFSANVNFPGAPLFPARGEVLVFNSRIRGKPGLLLHLYGTSPVQAAFVLPFTITSESRGKFGTVFATKIPQLASDLGYVTSIDLTIGREYSYKGERRSFISASCAAAAGFPGATFELARATFSFANGQRLKTGLTRDCKVR
jgi:hypothetical protein